MSRWGVDPAHRQVTHHPHYKCAAHKTFQNDLKFYDDDDDANGDDDDDDNINLLHCHLRHLKAPYLPLVGFHLDR